MVVIKVLGLASWMAIMTRKLAAHSPGQVEDLFVAAASHSAACSSIETAVGIEFSPAVESNSRGRAA
jgi:hypothetical protein